MKLARHSFSPFVGACLQAIRFRRPSKLRASAFLPLVLATSLSAQPAPQQPVPEQLDLKTAIGFAIENNFAIRQARERIRQQEGVLIEVRAREIPNVGATGLVQHNDLALTQTNPASNRYWSLSLTASQLLFAG